MTSCEIIAVTFLLVPVPILAQIGNATDGCSTCDITLEHVATLGRPEDPVALSRITEYAVGPDGKIVAFRTYAPGVVTMYSDSGRYSRSFGRAGRGPGEFGANPLSVSLHIDSDGRVHIIEGDRHTVVERGLDSLVRTNRVPANFIDALPLDGDRTVVTTRGGGGGHPSQVQIIDADGRVSPIVSSPSGDPAVRYLAPSRNGGFWVAHRDRYLVEEYDREGARVRTLARDHDWFEPLEAGTPPPAAFSRPTLLDLYEDESGRLWLLIRVPEPDRERRERALGSGQVRLDALDWSAVQDTRIEVLDLETGELLASTSFDQALRLLEGGYVLGRSELPSGLLQAHVSRLSLRQNGGK